MAASSEHKRRSLTNVPLDSILLVGISCAVAFLIGVLSSFLLLRRDTVTSLKLKIARPEFPALRTGAETGESDADLKPPFSDDVREIPMPDLADGDVYLVGVTVADSVDVRRRIVLRQAWTGVWRNRSHIRGRAQTLLGTSTWLRDDMGCSDFFRHYFLVSQFALLDARVRLEAYAERDIIFSELNIFASKSLRLLWSLHWLLSHTKFHYLMITGPETFVYVPSAVWWLRESKEVSRGRYYGGKVLRKVNVVRDTHSPWIVSKFVFSQPVYPDYVLGMCVMMSRDVVRTLASDWMAMLELGKEHARQLLHMEDVDMGLSLYHAGLLPEDIVHVYPNWESGLCHDSDLVAIGRVPEDVLLTSNAASGFHLCKR